MSKLKRALESLDGSDIEWKTDFDTPEELYDSEEYKSVNSRLRQAKLNLEESKLKLHRSTEELEEAVAKDFFGDTLGLGYGAYARMSQEDIEKSTEKVLKHNPVLGVLIEDAKDDVKESRRLVEKAESLYERLIEEVLGE